MFFLITILITSLSTAKVYSSVATLYPSKDNTLYQSIDEDLSNGAGPHFFSGSTISFGLRRSLLYFDVRMIPIGSEIISAKLILFMDRTAVGTYPIAAHRLLNNWGESSSIGARGGGLGGPAEEGDTTWLHRFFPNVLWKNPGGDFVQEPSAITDVDAEGMYEWSGDDLIEDIKIWTTNPEFNAGWILIGEEDFDGITTKRFVGKDSNNANQWPTLKIVYDIPSNNRPKTWGEIKTKNP